MLGTDVVLTAPVRRDEHSSADPAGTGQRPLRRRGARRRGRAAGASTSAPGRTTGAPGCTTPTSRSPPASTSSSPSSSARSCSARAAAETERSDADRRLLADTAGRPPRPRPHGRRRGWQLAAASRLSDDHRRRPDPQPADPTPTAARCVSSATRAGRGAWYEFFPRSEGAMKHADGSWQSGTFRTAAQRLPAIAAMGFDVVYIPPIHPIGRTNRKGPNNTLTAGPNDPGLALRHRLSSGRARRHPPRPRHGGGPRVLHRRGEARNGLEIALDIALQASPDHPWVTDAPRVLHDPARRLDRLRGEPAEEVPGHLPAELRQRPRGHLRGDAAHLPCTGSTST